MPSTDLIIKNESIAISIALVNVPLLSAARRAPCSACSFDLTKNVPIIEATIPKAAIVIGTVTPPFPSPAATASADVETIAPTYDS